MKKVVKKRDLKLIKTTIKFPIKISNKRDDMKNNEIILIIIHSRKTLIKRKMYFSSNKKTRKNKRE